MIGEPLQEKHGWSIMASITSQDDTHRLSVWHLVEHFQFCLRIECNGSETIIFIAHDQAESLKKVINAL